MEEELKRKIEIQHSDLCAQDRQIDELEAKVRELEAKYDIAITFIAERDEKIKDLNTLLDSADHQAKEDAKLVRNLRALLDESKIVADHWRELAFKLEDEIRGAA